MLFAAAMIGTLRVKVYTSIFFLPFSFFPLDVLDEILDLIESVSEGFLTYYYKGKQISFSFLIFLWTGKFYKHRVSSPLGAVSSCSALFLLFFSTDWNLKFVFGRILHDRCPLAEESKVYVDVTLHQVKLC